MTARRRGGWHLAHPFPYLHLPKTYTCREAAWKLTPKAGRPLHQHGLEPQRISQRRATAAQPGAGEEGSTPLGLDAGQGWGAETP